MVELEEKRQKLKELEGQMKEIIKEREEEIHGLILGLLSRKHIFLVGPPGTAKSMMIRMLNDCVEDSEYFDWLLTKYTEPDELFGPPKLSALKNDSYKRNIDGKLPTANFAFLDEIWKANSSILNTLLTILNERKFHNNGSPIDVPLETVMSAANELPEDREELGALWDRFLLKYYVKPVQQDSEFKEILELGDDAEIDVSLTLEEIHKAQEEIRNVEIPEKVLNNVIEIRKTLNSKGIQPSDRRYREAMKVVKAEAWLNGSDTARVDDLRVLESILWDDIDHISKVRKVVTGVSNPYIRRADELYDGIQDAWRQVEKADDSERSLEASDANSKIKERIEELKGLKEDMEDENRRTDKIDKYIKRAKEIREDKILEDILGV